MLYGLLADLVVVAHLGFLGFVAAGGLLAWHRPRVLLAHVPSVVWAVASLTVGLPCPLTGLEKVLRTSAGEPVYGSGFVDRYVEGVLWPESLTPVLQAMAAGTVLVGWAGLHHRRRRITCTQTSPTISS